MRARSKHLDGRSNKKGHHNVAPCIPARRLARADKKFMRRMARNGSQKPQHFLTRSLWVEVQHITKSRAARSRTCIVEQFCFSAPTRTRNVAIEHSETWLKIG